MTPEEKIERLVADVIELQRKINLLADRVLHYYNHTTPEIDELKERVDSLEHNQELLRRHTPGL